MNHLRAGDTLLVWRLDRLGRTLKHLIATITDLSDKGIGFKSLQENMDTITSGGKLIFHIFGALAEFEREVIRERTNRRLTSRQSQGQVRRQTKAPESGTEESSPCEETLRRRAYAGAGDMQDAAYREKHIVSVC